MFLMLLSLSPAVAAAWLVAVVASLTIHEFSHALVAKWLGDRTAEREGRLSLNPLAHVDWLGFISMVLIGVGWAKPVPFNPYNLKNPKWDAVKISLAGPAANLILATVSALILRLLMATGMTSSSNLLEVFLLLMVILNLFLMFFNVIPVAPLDGSKLFFALFSDPKYKQLCDFVRVRGPQILFFFILLSLLTSIDIFVIVSAPAYAVCSGLVGHDCLGLLYQVFGG